MDRRQQTSGLVTPAQVGATAALAHLGRGFGRIVGIFHEVVGERIAQYATATALRDGVLTVRCTSSSWAQTINMMDQDLITRLNERLGEGTVTRIRARAGAPSQPTEAELRRPEPAPLEPLGATEEQQLAELVASISDPALRASVLAAARVTTQRRNSTS